MNFAIIVSKKDQAGMNIKKQLEKLNSKIPTYEFEKETVYLEHIDEKIKEDFIIFATRHQSVKHNKTLSIHVAGNFKNNELGGEKNKVCTSNASILKNFFLELDKQQKENEHTAKDYSLTLECTHHGPLIEKPSLFIEIGSSEEEWNDEEAASVVARTIINSVRNVTNSNQKHPAIVGLGGPHYCPNFNKIELNSKYAISHIIPEYLMPITKEMIEESIKKTQEKIEFFVLDWKGLGKSDDRQKVINALEDLGLTWKRTSDVEKD